VNDAPCSSDAALLLPWFVTGRLDAGDAARVEQHLQACESCRAEVEHDRALHGLLGGDDRPSGLSPSAGFQALMARIGETERAMPGVVSHHAGTQPPMTHRASRWLAAAVVVQALALALLGTALWRDTEVPAPYRTLTQGASSPATEAHLRVVFAPETTARELGALLAAVDARIVDGPSPAGAYAISLMHADGEALASSLATLRANPRVLFAEPLRVETSR
jgi:anti-sigma factor RsiW